MLCLSLYALFQGLRGELDQQHRDRQELQGMASYCQRGNTIILVGSYYGLPS